MIQQEPQENGLPKIVIYHSSVGMILEGYTWKRIQVFYDRLMNDGLACEPILDLVKAITASPYAFLLHAITSHTDLLVFGYSPFEVAREMVRIEYLYQEKQLLFTYQEYPFLFGYPEYPGRGRPSWRKICSPDESKPVFEHLIIHLLKWVPQEFRRARAREYEQAGFFLTF